MKAPFFTIIGAIVLVASSVSAAQPEASTVVGPVKCAECHKSAAKIWEATHHYTTFRELPRKDKAREIADKMGIKRIKAESLCLSCHFTTAIEDGREEAIAGISCESCHSGAKNWLKRHGEYSGHEKKEDESTAEAAQRWAEAEAAGMIRPKELYRLAKNCFSCHVVPQEKLVNIGGHPAGSPFELVSWSQGEIRHNTWHSPDRANRLATAERQRMMYVVGTAVELEISLRAVASATTKDRYAVSMAKRAQLAKNRMAKIAETVTDPGIAAIVAAANSAALKLNNADELNRAAAEVAKATQDFAASHDGSKLAALDTLIPGADQFKGVPAHVPNLPAN